MFSSCVELNWNDMKKIIIKTRCPDKQINGLCYVDGKPITHKTCESCEYGKFIKEEEKEKQIYAALFSGKYDNLTCKEIRELFVIELI